MKRTFCVLAAAFAFVAACSAQSLSLKVGTVVLNHDGVMNNQRIEALCAYPLSDKFDVTLATGYDRAHLDAYSVAFPHEFGIVSGNRAVNTDGTTSYPAITHHFIPIVAGVKYSFAKKSVSPYLTAELGGYLDLASKSEIEARYGTRMAGDFNPGTIIKLGGGAQYRLSESMMFDVSVRAMHESTDEETIEVMAGIVLPL